jgi:hypothetical protein
MIKFPFDPEHVMLSAFYTAMAIWGVWDTASGIYIILHRVLGG